MKKQSAYRFDSITDIHRALGLPKPMHPLISLINNTNHQIPDVIVPEYAVHNFYKIKFITKLSGRLRYGQGYYDFDEGSMLFTAPNQIVGTGGDPIDHSVYALLIHPDFLQGYPTAKKIGHYGYFAYSTNEALHLSDGERATIFSVFKIIEEELNSRIDDFSQEVMIAQIELLLSYANRFYKRQFITRKLVSNELLQKLENVLTDYFDDDQHLKQGLPSVKYLAEQLSLSPHYLTDMLRSLTGRNTQQHIHDKLIEKAKEKLSTTTLSVSEVAYALGFDYPQSFSKLFKTKTSLSPLAYRQSFKVE
jgi:AraC family transcriptional activator of pobA